MVTLLLCWCVGVLVCSYWKKNHMIVSSVMRSQFRHANGYYTILSYESYDFLGSVVVLLLYKST